MSLPKRFPSNALVLQEVTVWDSAVQPPNHIYILNSAKSKMLAYVRTGTTDVTVFANPQNFSTSYRKFKPVQLPDGYRLVKPNGEIL